MIQKYLLWTYMQNMNFIYKYTLKWLTVKYKVTLVDGASKNAGQRVHILVNPSHSYGYMKIRLPFFKIKWAINGVIILNYAQSFDEGGHTLKIRVKKFRASGQSMMSRPSGIQIFNQGE